MDADRSLRPAVTVELDPDVDDSSDRIEPLFSHVKGGPDTCIGLGCALPTVAAWRTVPKSQRSSGSLLALSTRRFSHVR